MEGEEVALVARVNSLRLQLQYARRLEQEIQRQDMKELMVEVPEIATKIATKKSSNSFGSPKSLLLDVENQSTRKAIFDTARSTTQQLASLKHPQRHKKLPANHHGTEPISGKKKALIKQKQYLKELQAFKKNRMLLQEREREIESNRLLNAQQTQVKKPQSSPVFLSKAQLQDLFSLSLSTSPVPPLKSHPDNLRRINQDYNKVSSQIASIDRRIKGQLSAERYHYPDLFLRPILEKFVMQRCRAAWQAWSRVVEWHRHEEQRLAKYLPHCLHISRLIRGFLARRRVLRIREQRELEAHQRFVSSVVIIQNNFRIYSSKNKYFYLLQHRNKELVVRQATALQALARGFLARRAAKQRLRASMWRQLHSMSVFQSSKDLQAVIRNCKAFDDPQKRQLELAVVVMLQSKQSFAAYTVVEMLRVAAPLAAIVRSYFQFEQERARQFLTKEQKLQRHLEQQTQLEVQKKAQMQQQLARQEQMLEQQTRQQQRHEVARSKVQRRRLDKEQYEQQQQQQQQNKQELQARTQLQLAELLQQRDEQVARKKSDLEAKVAAFKREYKLLLYEDDLQFQDQVAAVKREYHSRRLTVKSKMRVAAHQQVHNLDVIEGRVTNFRHSKRFVENPSQENEELSELYRMYEEQLEEATAMEAAALQAAAQAHSSTVDAHEIEFNKQLMFLENGCHDELSLFVAEWDAKLPANAAYHKKKKKRPAKLDAKTSFPAVPATSPKRSNRKVPGRSPSSSRTKKYLKK